MRMKPTFRARRNAQGGYGVRRTRLLQVHLGVFGFGREGFKSPRAGMQHRGSKWDCVTQLKDHTMIEEAEPAARIHVEARCPPTRFIPRRLIYDLPPLPRAAHVVRI